MRIGTAIEGRPGRQFAPLGELIQNDAGRQKRWWKLRNPVLRIHNRAPALVGLTLELDINLDVIVFAVIISTFVGVDEAAQLSEQARELSARRADAKLIDFPDLSVEPPRTFISWYSHGVLVQGKVGYSTTHNNADTKGADKFKHMFSF